MLEPISLLRENLSAIYPSFQRLALLIHASVRDTLDYTRVSKGPWLTKAVILD